MAIMVSASMNAGSNSPCFFLCLLRGLQHFSGIFLLQFIVSHTNYDKRMGLEKGIIFDIKRFAVHDGPGIRTTVFFKGCPLRCLWCHNPEGIDAAQQSVKKKLSMGDKSVWIDEIVGMEYTAPALMNELEKDYLFMEESSGGVTLSGGEPLMQAAFLLQLLPLLKKRKVHVALDTCGYASPAIMAAVLPYVDLFLFDLKHTDAQIHRKLTGVDLVPILANLHEVLQRKCNVRIRIPYIPGIQDDAATLSAYIRILAPHRSDIEAIDILPYHSIAANKYRRFGLANRVADWKEPTEEEINNFARAFRCAGFHVTIGG
ncbi:MAG: glycyl-radical enzyme activating protein [Bacteroidales bacterium]|nr:glycyl-radical enzyme activating protein [Bacteroidales bacterium]